DSAAGMVKGVVTDESFNWADDRPPNVPWSDTAIYEVHLRGLTMLREDIRTNERGTFAALADPKIIDHLRRLGITAIELLPIHAFVQDRTLLEKGLRNYWGYNTLGFFAVEPRYHVDGFRFDLGVTLGREPHGFDPGAGFFDGLRQDPVLSRVKLISEPWDLGPGGYQLGHHPPGFAEWNDRYRDSIRRFWRGNAGERPELAARLAGSSDLFDRHARRPWASINYVASHDGFTLADVVSFTQRHNEANGETNNDGSAENYSANWGIEGPTSDDK